jgi:cobalt transporter subunit CbtA
LSQASDVTTPGPLAGLLTAALIAGLLAGLLATALQALLVWPLIEQAEVYEQAAAHQQPAPSPHDAADHHDTSPLQRVALSVLTDIAVGVGYALLLAAAMVLARTRLDWRHGLAWGLAGYLALVAAPAIGLQPVPPGVETGALGARQAWWIATALCTASGLALVLLTRGRLRIYAIAAGVALIAAPQKIGAPVTPADGVAPLELRRQFAWMVLLTTLPPWLVTGAVLGWRLDRDRASP